jgi:hypothetical protein
MSAPVAILYSEKYADSEFEYRYNIVGSTVGCPRYETFQNPDNDV